LVLAFTSVLSSGSAQATLCRNTTQLSDQYAIGFFARFNTQRYLDLKAGWAQKARAQGLNFKQEVQKPKSAEERAALFSLMAEHKGLPDPVIRFLTAKQSGLFSKKRFFKNMRSLFEGDISEYALRELFLDYYYVLGGSPRRLTSIIHILNPHRSLLWESLRASGRAERDQIATAEAFREHGFDVVEVEKPGRGQQIARILSLGLLGRPTPLKAQQVYDGHNRRLALRWAFLNSLMIVPTLGQTLPVGTSRFVEAHKSKLEQSLPDMIEKIDIRGPQGPTRADLQHAFSDPQQIQDYRSLQRRAGSDMFTSWLGQAMIASLIATFVYDNIGLTYAWLEYWITGDPSMLLNGGYI
jgi:hypothetical protein